MLRCEAKDIITSPIKSKRLMIVRIEHATIILLGGFFSRVSDYSKRM